MPFDPIVAPRSWDDVTVPGGTRRSPWLVSEHGPITFARTYTVAYGPQLLRAADEPSVTPTESKSRARRRSVVSRA